MRLFDIVRGTEINVTKALRVRTRVTAPDVRDGRRA
jgi:hypothetical protein